MQMRKQSQAAEQGAGAASASAAEAETQAQAAAQAALMGRLLAEDAQLPIGAPALADCMHLEANVLQTAVVQDAAPIEEERGLLHSGIEFVVGVGLEFVPLREHDESMGALHCLLRRLREDEATLVDLHVVVCELGHCILLLHLRVIDMNTGAILEQHVTYTNCRCLSHIAGVLLEGETKDCNLFVGHSVEKAGDDLAGEALLLVLVQRLL